MKIAIGAPRVLGIEIDNYITRVVETEYRAKVPKIYKAFSVPTPEEMLSSEGILSENEEFKRAFTGACSANGVSPDRVSFTVYSSRIINREITIPAIKASKIESLIYENATDYFPVNLNDYKLIYNVIGVTGKDRQKQQRILVCAVPRDIIKSYYTFAEFMGLNIIAIDYIGNGLYQTLKAANHDLAKQTTGVTNMYVSVNSRSTLLSFIRDGAIQMQRVVGIGVANLMESLSMSLITDENVKLCDFLHKQTEFPYFCRSLSAADESSGDEQSYPIDFLCANTELVRPLISAILRSVEYYKSIPANADHTIVGYMTGTGLLLNGFEELLANELDIRFDSMQIGLDKKVLSQAETGKVSFAEYYACIGACTAPINLANKVKAQQYSVVELFNDPQFQSTLLAIGLVCFGVCIALSVCFFFLPMAENNYVKNQETRLRSEFTSLSGAKIAFTEYSDTTQVYNSVLHITDYLTTYNDNIVSFIEEFEEKMPKSFSATSFSVSETGVAMNIHVDSKQQAAYVIMALREFKTARLASISNITDDESTTGYSASPYLDANGDFIRTNLSSAYTDYTDAQLIAGLGSGQIDPYTLYVTKVTTQSGERVLNPLLVAVGVTEADVLTFSKAVETNDFTGIDTTDPKVLAVYNLYTTGQINRNNIYVTSTGTVEMPVTDIEVIELTMSSVSFSVSLEYSDFLLNPNADENSAPETSNATSEVSQ